MLQSIGALDCLIEGPEQASACIIWLHGLGADGHDFAGISKQLPRTRQQAVRYIFPHAPMQPVTINQGHVMRAWFDIRNLQRMTNEDVAGMQDSLKNIQALIKQQQALGIPSEKIFVAGFSQGGTMALLTALFHPERLGGYMALSGFLPQFAGANLKNASPHTPRLLIAHGSNDEIVPLFLGKAASQVLINAGYQVEWHEYAMGHSVCTQELLDIDAYIQRQLGSAQEQLNH